MDLIWALALSGHLGFENTYNNFHPHIRVEEGIAIGGAYYNSEERISLYGGIRLEPVDKFGLELGLANGYPALGGVVPYARGTYDVGDMRLFITPGGEKRHGEINYGAVIGIEYIFNK